MRVGAEGMRCVGWMDGRTVQYSTQQGTRIPEQRTRPRTMQTGADTDRSGQVRLQARPWRNRLDWTDPVLLSLVLSKWRCLEALRTARVYSE